jgi:hypothetical protein
MRRYVLRQDLELNFSTHRQGLPGWRALYDGVLFPKQLATLAKFHRDWLAGVAKFPAGQFPRAFQRLGQDEAQGRR